MAAVAAERAPTEASPSHLATMKPIRTDSSIATIMPTTSEPQGCMSFGTMRIAMNAAKTPTATCEKFTTLPSRDMMVSRTPNSANVPPAVSPAVIASSGFIVLPWRNRTKIPGAGRP